MDRKKEVHRRNFLYVASGVFAATGSVISLWPLIDSMNPSADVLALSTVEVDLSPIEVGQAITVKWRGRPVFIRRRTPEEIAHARAVDISELRDPETDVQRIKPGYDEWLVMIGVCTHLGCIPLGQKPGDPKGEYGGWFCPCHGSHYDMSGRIRKGPAPRNLDIPPYAFLTDSYIRIG
ncbi:ubiquinol-cytochrome c reductase iron-sulfur subunit [Luteithermobacter gelatinilyticus]|uniref:ubiquinol-cytochrome c reductase iron-sulfur subunit n=1 Tax=Luteithermobacter gelatinilyticus TaxID=2582913 RepID=UPI001106DD50|nr:ubiquinol-cytochrome c reductase iron-sulfur subunit [Luteithermobacter gelatinilyticus]